MTVSAWSSNRLLLFWGSSAPCSLSSFGGRLYRLLSSHPHRCGRSGLLPLFNLLQCGRREHPGGHWVLRGCGCSCRWLPAIGLLLCCMPCLSNVGHALVRWQLKEYLIHSDPGSHQLTQKGVHTATDEMPMYVSVRHRSQDLLGWLLSPSVGDPACSSS